MQKDGQEKTLYDILMVAEDATLEMIKRAFRYWMRTHHPDKNGGVHHDDHDAVQHAYDVLSDTERREQYDLTGDDSDARDITGEAQAMVAKVLMQIMANDATLVNVSEEIRKSLIGELKRLKSAISGTESAISAIDKVMARSKERGKATFIRGVLGKMMDAAVQHKKYAESEIKVVEAALMIVDDYHYDYEDRPGIPSGSLLGGFGQPIAGDRGRSGKWHQVF